MTAQAPAFDAAASDIPGTHHDIGAQAERARKNFGKSAGLRTASSESVVALEPCRNPGDTLDPKPFLVATMITRVWGPWLSSSEIAGAVR